MRLEREVVEDQQVDPQQLAHLGVVAVVEPGGPQPLEQQSVRSKCTL